MVTGSHDHPVPGRIEYASVRVLTIGNPPAASPAGGFFLFTLLAGFGYTDRHGRLYSQTPLVLSRTGLAGAWLAGRGGAIVPGRTKPKDGLAGGSLRRLKRHLKGERCGDDWIGTVRTAATYRILPARQLLSQGFSCVESFFAEPNPGQPSEYVSIVQIPSRFRRAKVQTVSLFSAPSSSYGI